MVAARGSARVQPCRLRGAASHFTKALNRLSSMPASAERDHDSLEVELGYALIPVRGWAAPDTARPSPANYLPRW
jgi:hypothetical protein